MTVTTAAEVVAESLAFDHFEGDQRATREDWRDSRNGCALTRRHYDASRLVVLALAGSPGLREQIARAMSVAVDDECFRHEQDDPERWAVDEEDRGYYFRMADAALAVLVAGSGRTQETPDGL